LKSIGLFESCMSIFVEHHIDDAALPLINEQDLKEIGTLPLGDRVKFNTWLNEYKKSYTSTPSGDDNKKSEGTDAAAKSESAVKAGDENDEGDEDENGDGDGNVDEKEDGKKEEKEDEY